MRMELVVALAMRTTDKLPSKYFGQPKTNK
jgi:hypothetical protein